MSHIKSINIDTCALLMEAEKDQRPEQGIRGLNQCMVHSRPTVRILHPPPSPHTCCKDNLEAWSLTACSSDWVLGLRAGPRWTSLITPNELMGHEVHQLTRGTRSVSLISGITVQGFTCLRLTLLPFLVCHPRDSLNMPFFWGLIFVTGCYW